MDDAEADVEPSATTGHSIQLPIDSITQQEDDRCLSSPCRVATSEDGAAEQLVLLKTDLRTADTERFWSVLMEGLTRIAGSQCGFVARRSLVEDEYSVSDPADSESRPLGIACYYNDGHGATGMRRDFRYASLGAHCAHLRQDKVFVVTERRTDTTSEDGHELPFLVEAYLGVPLFEAGQCFAHLGLVWSREGAAARPLSWSYLEMLLHTVEDMVVSRLRDGDEFARPETEPSALPSPTPLQRTKSEQKDPIAASQSFRPYARSLSHELRTPMQGVVGMLDMMHATVQEAVEDHSGSGVGDVLQSLKEDIEVVQDSSRRAVEAADNVVHAYDLNMQVPDTPVPRDDVEQSEDSRSQTGYTNGESYFPEAGVYSFQRSGKKRRRCDTTDTHASPAFKYRALESSGSPIPSPRYASPLHYDDYAKQAVRESDRLTGSLALGNGRGSTPQIESRAYTPEIESAAPAGIRHSKVRELLHQIIYESLRVGGRPDYAIANDTERGESIDVRSRSSDGEVKSKTIEWSVDPAIPETIAVDERDLAKLVSCVLLNALKFTERGIITLKATLSPKGRFIVINVVDTGPGIPQAFLPNLFKPFSQEDDSTTRQKDGLGLGLLVAKGLVRKVGGDLTCVKSDTSGPARGSEFEIRMPLASSDAGSHPGSPLVRTPTPSRCSPEQFSPQLADSPPRIQETTEAGRVATAADASPQDPVVGLVSPLVPVSSLNNSRRSSTDKPKPKKALYNKRLAERYPLRFLVAEDNKINRRLLVSMLRKLGYADICEAHDGAEAVRQMGLDREDWPIDIVLMDLWMPFVDGYEATQRILSMPKHVAEDGSQRVTVLAVTADVTAEALERAAQAGMEGFMTKPYKLIDLERLIIEYCTKAPRPTL